MHNQRLNNRTREDFEIISQDDRIKRDPRGLGKFTLLSNGSAIVKKVITAPSVEQVPKDPAVSMAEELRQIAARSEIMPRELGEEI